MRRSIFITVVCLLLILCVSCSSLPENVPASPELTPDPAQTPEPSSALTPEPAVSADPAAPTQRPASPAPSPDDAAPGIPVSSAPASLLLRLGSTGPQVAEAKEQLIALLYLPTSAASQYFDENMREAVKAFQACAGLEITGMIDEATQAVLFSPAAPANPVPVMPEETIAPEPLPLAGIRIGLDPGHQGRGSASQEPAAPGSSVTKPRVSSGTAGIASGVAEHVVNLAVGLKLRDILVSYGAEVVMTRESADVDISNKERAQLLNDAGADLAVRLHCDGETDKSRHGAFVLIPAGPYTTAIQPASRTAGQCVLDAFCAVTGAKNLGLSERDDQTGFNWSTVPVINIEMGHMSNREEDLRLVDDGYQNLCAQGIANGILNYFTS